MDLSRDEIEFLWSIAKRSSTDFPLPVTSLQRLVDLGLLEFDVDWPKLTAAGFRVLHQEETRLRLGADGVAPKSD